jgi:20S proteasome subunit beta 7
MKYDGGVIIAADTLGSYGSMARFPDLKRVLKVNDSTVLGVGGDYADFQFLSEIIKQKQIDEDCKDDGFTLKPKALHCWLTRVLYNRRSKFDPLWNVIIVAGMQDNEPYLGFCNLQGTAFTGKVDLFILFLQIFGLTR